MDAAGFQTDLLQKRGQFLRFHPAEDLDEFRSVAAQFDQFAADPLEILFQSLADRVHLNAGFQFFHDFLP